MGMLVRRLRVGPYALLVRVVGAPLCLALLQGCGPPSLDDLRAKSHDAHTPEALTAALGRPDRIEPIRGAERNMLIEALQGTRDPAERAKINPVERWIYRASNGELTFEVVGDRLGVVLPPGPSRK